MDGLDQFLKRMQQQHGELVDKEARLVMGLSDRVDYTKFCCLQDFFKS